MIVNDIWKVIFPNLTENKYNYTRLIILAFNCKGFLVDLGLGAWMNFFYVHTNFGHRRPVVCQPSTLLLSLILEIMDLQFKGLLLQVV